MEPTSRITIIGLGPGPIALLTLQALETMQRAPRVVLRTIRHPAVEALGEYGIRYLACDDLYDTHDSFERVYGEIVRRVIALAEQDGAVVYAVPGDPLVAERTVQLLLQAGEEREDLAVEVLPALGALNLMLHRLRLDPGDGLLIADARDPRLRPVGEAPDLDDHEAYHGSAPIDPRYPTLWFQVDSSFVASNLKILLLEQYPPEHPVTVLTAIGTPGEEEMTAVPLAEFDRGPAITHLTSLYVPALPWQQRKFTPLDLRAIFALLRSDKGCPWDREQDMRSLRRTVIEEAYEVVDAIDRDDPQMLADELGDLLLQVYFLAQLGYEEGIFDIDDVVQALAEKLIRRHTHVFGEAEAETAHAVVKNWEQIKAGERAQKGAGSIFDDVPLALPALARSQKLQKRAARVGFDWRDFRGPLLKLHEELEELSQEVGVMETWPRPPLLDNPLAENPDAQRRAESAPRDRLVHEVGDILFAAVNLCRFLHLDAEEVMREANDRFIRRFQRMEAAAKTQGRNFADLTLEEMDQVWLAVKGND